METRVSCKVFRQDQATLVSHTIHFPTRAAYIYLLPTRATKSLLARSDSSSSSTAPSESDSIDASGSDLKKANVKKYRAHNSL